jgi:heme-degrading monooxygenase HmoA
MSSETGSEKRGKSMTAAIARIWRGCTLPGNADLYADYLHEHGVLKLQALGANAVQMLREDRKDESHFMVISWWPNRQAMVQWAGDDPTKIRHLPRDAELLIELPQAVQIMDLVSATGNFAGLGSF